MSVRLRARRNAIFEVDLFSDPAWDMLLELAASEREGRDCSVTGLGHCAGVPPTTSLRYLTRLENAGLVERRNCETDQRRFLVVLTDKARSALIAYFVAAGASAA